jgi:type I restriction enzyme, S subunit
METAQGPWELPKGWMWCRVEELVEKTERRDPRLSPDRPFTYVDIASIDNKSATIVAGKEMLGKDAPSRARKVIRTGDVIFATTRPYLRNIALVPDLYENQICSTGFCVLRADSRTVEPSWLYYLCRSDLILMQTESKMRGASYPAITDGDVLSASAPLPGIETQRRIVARIESLLAEVQQARALLEEMRRDVGGMMDAVLGERFGELDRAGVIFEPLGSLLLDKPQYGTSQKAYETPPGTPILRMGNIVDGKLSLDNLKYVRLDPLEEEKYLLNPGDILFNRTNSAELVGKSAVFESHKPAVFASYLIRLVVDPAAVIPKYVVAYINSQRGRTYIQSQLTRAIGQVNVNAKKIAAMPLPLPNLDEQERIVAYLDSVQSKVDRMRRMLDEEERLLGRLERSILERAFRGEL